MSELSGAAAAATNHIVRFFLLQAPDQQQARVREAVLGLPQHCSYSTHIYIQAHTSARTYKHTHTSARTYTHIHTHSHINTFTHSNAYLRKPYHEISVLLSFPSFLTD
eukprot:GHVU01021402.1.p1 GENE.GHVU01021402.1~~GHVU01021402.1.p1  ORF type:complete len:108 (+),score=7.73 GHVU01021402.1:140-463(+)